MNEFQRFFGDMLIDLDSAARTGAQHFVDALVDSEPNRLDAPFREALRQQTGGHPLFTVEMLRDLRARDILVRDEVGHWVVKVEPEWDALPARVEGTIAERVGRLDEALREMLAIASVEGETFTAEVIAQVQSADERGVVRRLSGELTRQHRHNVKGTSRIDGLAIFYQ